ncbi:MAG: pyridoxal-phosphate dependent enzyme [Acidobacteriota bacterium]|nr:MAG: pyridoxal-phosphate dependent enzyme [Acidobacteriota bacterium]
MDPVASVSLERIAAARSVIDPVFLDTPQFQNDALSDLVDAEIILKVECVNPVRSFKGRGAEYFTHVHKDSAPRPWTCASAGNFGQGLAYAARKHEIRLIVYAASTANTFKVERMRQLGAEVHLVGDDFDAAKDACRRFASDEGCMFIEDGRDIAITEGAGTLGVELLQRREPLDAVLIPVGNGALINGVGTWVKAHAPETLVIGTGAGAAPAMERSFREQKVVTTASVSTIADGVATRVPVPEAVTTMVAVTDDMLLVDDDAIRRAMAAIERELGLKVEPAGAVPLAAATTHRERFRGKRLALVISGSNVSGE